MLLAGSADSQRVHFGRNVTFTYAGILLYGREAREGTSAVHMDVVVDDRVFRRVRPCLLRVVNQQMKSYGGRARDMYGFVPYTFFHSTNHSTCVIVIG